MQILGKTYRDLFYLVCNTCYTKTHITYVESGPRGHLDHS